MAERISETLQKKISDRLGFYEDLGIHLFYRYRGAVANPNREPLLESPASTHFSTPELQRGETLPKPAGRPALQKAAPVMTPPSPKIASLPVAAGGADEDAQGLPFVGRAGKLLTQMIEAMGLQRKDVYICNVVKCRPPENRQPEEDEVRTCSPFLMRQIDTIAPKVIVCLGAVAAKTLLQTNRGISQFRGEWLEFRGRKLLATYHPAYLLRNPAAKSEVWKDLQKVMAVLGLEVKKGKSS